MRVYEDRMDLLRAVIVGAYGTPYQDGLFFFDFHLPPTYPDVPPVRNALSNPFKCFYLEAIRWSYFTKFTQFCLSLNLMTKGLVVFLSFSD